MAEIGARLQLTQVELRGFKAAFSPPPVSLLPFNLLVGRNGSGKSTLVEALQWIDTAIRKDVHEACDPYNGIGDLIHQRVAEPRCFQINLQFSVDELKSGIIQETKVDGTNGVARVRRDAVKAGGLGSTVGDDKDRLRTGRDSIHIVEVAGNGTGEFPNPAAGLLLSLGNCISTFWHDAVFLRLIPARLAEPAPLHRKSFEPILDESGRLLPVLLSEVLANADQRDELVGRLQDILPWARDLEVPRLTTSRDLPSSWVLHETPSQPDQPALAIPAWMLSEGTRRLTAILALLVRDPAPSLLCIEEVENGLDPWTVRALLRELQSAGDRGTQVIATTHFPWVLDDVPMASILQVRRVAGDVVYERFADRPEVQRYHPSVPAGTRYVNESE